MEKELCELELQFQDKVKDLKYEVIDVEYLQEGGYNYLRVYIENYDTSSISLDDCEKVSNLISDLAEKHIDNEFILEVSSPGLDRKLKKTTDFIRFAGEKISVKTKSNIYDKKSFVGILKGYENGEILLTDENLGDINIPIVKLKQSKIVLS